MFYSSFFAELHPTTNYYIQFRQSRNFGFLLKKDAIQERRKKLSFYQRDQNTEGGTYPAAEQLQPPIMLLIFMRSIVLK